MRTGDREGASRPLPLRPDPDSMAPAWRSLGVAGWPGVLLLASVAGAGFLTRWASVASTNASLLACLVIFWVVLSLNARALGAVAFSFGVLSLYSAGPWLAAMTGRRYPPFYRMDVLFDVARSTTATVTAAFGIVALILTFARHGAAALAWRRFALDPPPPGHARLLLLIVAVWGLMLRDLVVLVPKMGAALTAPRRAYAESLWLTSSLNIQLIYLCAAAVTTLTWPHLRRGQRFLLVTPLLGALLMQFIIGARKEALIAVAIAVPLLWLRAARRRLLMTAAAVVVGIGLALPAVRDADVALVPTEIALPGNASVAALTGQVTSFDIPYDFWQGVWAFVPSQLRPVSVNIDLGSAFAHFGFQSVAIGATPWLEAALAFPHSALVAATLLIATLHLAWRFLVPRVPLLAVTAWPFLMLLGRSTFWITVFGAVYLTLLTWAALSYKRSGSDS